MEHNGLLDNFYNAMAKMTEEEKNKLRLEVESTLKRMEAYTTAAKLRYDRAFVRDGNCLRYGSGIYHVYMWLHADGTPFYVGMGKGDRWKNACSRNEKFFEETKRLDTLVCKVIDGLSVAEAREAEFCLSHYLTYNGYKLANLDNNFLNVTNVEQADKKVGKYVRLMKKEYNNLTVEEAKKKMKQYDMPCDYDLIREQYILSFGYPA